jgi:hypothetical protein
VDASSDGIDVNTIGLDLPKNVFQVHRADGSGAVDFSKAIAAEQCFRCSPSDLRSVTATEDAIRAGQERSTAGCRSLGSRSTRALARDIPLAVVEPSSPTFVNRARTPANKLFQNKLCMRAVASVMILLAQCAGTQIGLLTDDCFSGSLRIRKSIYVSGKAVSLGTFFSSVSVSTRN